MTCADGNTEYADVRLKRTGAAHQPAEARTGMAQVAILGPDIDSVPSDEIQGMFSQQTVALASFGMSQLQAQTDETAQVQLPYGTEPSSNLQVRPHVYNLCSSLSHAGSESVASAPVAACTLRFAPFAGVIGCAFTCRFFVRARPVDHFRAVAIPSLQDMIFGNTCR